MCLFQLVRPGTRGIPADADAGAAAAGRGGGLPSPMSPMSGMTSDMEEAEAGEVKLPVRFCFLCEEGQSQNWH